jgi:hypothetical protein
VVVVVATAGGGGCSGIDDGEKGAEESKARMAPLSCPRGWDPSVEATVVWWWRATVARAELGIFFFYLFQKCLYKENKFGFMVL